MLPKKVVPFIGYFVKQQWPGFLGMFLTIAVWAINESLFPYFLKLTIDTVQGLERNSPNIWSQLLVPTIGLVGVWFAMDLAMRILGVINIFTFPKFRANIRKETLEYVKGHSHRYFSEHFSGSIANKINDLPKSSESMVEIFIHDFLGIMVAFSISLYLMSTVSVVFSGMMLIWFLAMIGISLALLKGANQRSATHADSVSTLNGVIVDIITNVLTMRLFARKQYEKKYIERYQNAEIKTAQKSLWFYELLNCIRGLMTTVFMMLMLYMLIIGWQEGWVTLGDFSLIAMSAFGMIGLIWHMSFNITRLFKDFGIIKAGLSLITKEHDIQDHQSLQTLHISQGEIKFDQVTFGYLKHNKLFQDKNLVIKPGEKVGLVGFSGSGKSTFVHLLLRFYNLDAGRIMIDGQDIHHVSQESLRDQIAMIPQEPTLFHRTLMENIRYGRLSASDEEVIEASKAAHCDDFIQHLEMGYHSLVGERGTKLSGGQKQRVSIARALLKNAKVLILDEATSALDTVTERLIQESLQKLMADKTTVVIAHRLSTLVDMDRILVFDQGKIVEDGSINELLKLNGYFAKMWNMQNDGFLPETAESANQD